VRTAITVAFDDGENKTRYVRYVGYDEFSLFLRPAYALTVNKAQGSEYEYVIVKSSSGWGDKRERFYTAVSRAKVKCIVYEEGSSNTECILSKASHRNTSLCNASWTLPQFALNSCRDIDIDIEEFSSSDENCDDWQ
jgi:ATP-dependent exoDNAse (exonuclease V) alpha subunit